MSNATFFGFQAKDQLRKHNNPICDQESLSRTQQNALEMLESHPHFRGRRRWVQCHYVQRCLYLTGSVPSYYLKQLAQEAIRELEGVDRVVNRIVVANPRSATHLG